tara:strand:- start:730 stop:1383 length:654 start_codon:yes stop_codon:yes gene_type:complete
MKKIVYLILLSIILNDKLPNDVRWTRNSQEYKAICNQIYSVALEKLDKYNIRNESVNSNYAVIMDLDETVLDNSQYQVELFAKNESFNMDSWAKWVLREEAKLVPGALNYIQSLRQKNIQIIFLSNRMDERIEATKNNLKKLDIYSESDIYLLRLDSSDKKTVRRNEVYTSTGRMQKYKQFNVIQYLGDAIGDFESSNTNRFGIDQFIFPNPMYGKW